MHGMCRGWEGMVVTELVISHLTEHYKRPCEVFKPDWIFKTNNVSSYLQRRREMVVLKMKDSCQHDKIGGQAETIFCQSGSKGQTQGHVIHPIYLINMSNISGSGRNKWTCPCHDMFVPEDGCVSGAGRRLGNCLFLDYITLEGTRLAWDHIRLLRLIR